MHDIHIVQTQEGKERPAVVLTRALALPHANWIVVVPITSTRRGLRSEVSVGTESTIDHESVINCDNIQSVPRWALGRRIGQLTIGQDRQLTEAIRHALELL